MSGKANGAWLTQRVRLPFHGQLPDACSWHTRRTGSPIGSLKVMREKTAQFGSMLGAPRKGACSLGIGRAPRCSVEAATDLQTAPDGPDTRLYSVRARMGAAILFGRVPPGRVTVFSPHRFADGELVRSQATQIEVRPGASAALTIGGSGRPLVGRLELVKPRAGLSLDEIEAELVPVADGPNVGTESTVPEPGSDATNQRSNRKAGRRRQLCIRRAARREVSHRGCGGGTLFLEIYTRHS